MFLKIFQISQSSYKYANEIFFVCLFVSVITVNKYVLSELKFTVPTVFQGWQSLPCVVLLSTLIKLKKITNDLQILDARALSLLLPALICYTFGTVAGSKALAELPVPVFLAVTNLYPALLVLLVNKNETKSASLKVCGSSAVIGTVTIIFVCSLTSANASAFAWLIAHVFLHTLYYLYLYKLNLDLTNTTQIYYRNFFSVIVLFPISIYLDVLHLPENRDWRFYSGCFLSGVLGTLLQIWTFKINKTPNYLQFEGLSKVICSLIAYRIFFTDVASFIWVLVVVNFLFCAAFLKNEEIQKANVKSDIVLSLSPPHHRYNRKEEEDGMSLV